MGLRSWFGGTWLRGTGSSSQAASAPVAPAAPPVVADPGWRALPPVQRVLAEGAQPVARLGDFAGSLATWQSPRMLSGLEHGRGPSAPAGSVAGIVDVAGGAPGPTSLPASPGDVVPLHGGSAARAAGVEVVQRSVRFAPSRASVQRVLSSGGSGAGEHREPSRSESFDAGPFAAAADVEPSGATPFGSEPSAAGSSPGPAGAEPSSSKSPSSSGSPSSGESSASAQPGFPTNGTAVGTYPTKVPLVGKPTSDESGASVVAQRSVAAWPTVAASPTVTASPTLGDTPLQRTLADPPTPRPVGAGPTLPQLPVVPDLASVQTLVTAPPQPTARPALPVVAVGASLQRSVTSTGTVANGPATSTTSAFDARPADVRPLDVGVAEDAAHTGDSSAIAASSSDDGPSPTSLPSAIPTPPAATGHAPLLADAPDRKSVV